MARRRAQADRPLLDEVRDAVARHCAVTGVGDLDALLRGLDPDVKLALVQHGDDR